MVEKMMYPKYEEDGDKPCETAKKTMEKKGRGKKKTTFPMISLPALSLENFSRKEPG